MTQDAASSARRAGRDALIAWAAVAVLVTGLVRIDVTLPWIGHVGSALVAVLFLFAPIAVAARRGEDIDDYGFHAEPIGKGLATAGAGVAAIFPLFALGYFAFYALVCDNDVLSHLAPAGTCHAWMGLRAIHAPELTGKLLEFCGEQLIVVALPEELFFRGMLLQLLEQRFPPKRRILGGGVGLALILSAAAFALVHLPKDGDPRALATFFPGLLFGWMRSSTGSILASTVTHGASNILIRILELSVHR